MGQSPHVVVNNGQLGCLIVDSFIMNFLFWATGELTKKKPSFGYGLIISISIMNFTGFQGVLAIKMQKYVHCFIIFI